jgi:hypothetical protein
VIWLIFDLLLLVGMTARLSRLVTTDYLGEWFIQDPADRWSDNKYRDEDRLNWKQKLRVGLDCPWCIGYWIGVATVLIFARVHGYWPDNPLEWWRVIAGSLTLNYVVAHMSARLD